MSKLSTITVSFGRKIQTRPYESADAAVSLTISYDHDEPQGDIDDEISQSMARAVAHVETTLNIETPADKPAAAPKEQAAKPGKPKAPGKPASAPKATGKPPAPAGNSESGKKTSKTSTTATKPVSPSEEKPSVTKGDMMKAISATMTALQSKGVTDGSTRVQEIVKEFLPEGAKPPFSYAKIEEENYAAFIAKVQELKNAK